MRATRQDDRLFYENLLQEGSELLQPHQVKQLWKVVRRSLPKYRQRRMQLHPSKVVGLEDDWLPHLADLEIGKRTSPDELIANFYDRRSPGSVVPTNGTGDLGQLPTLLELEEALRATKPGRSTGLDPFESEFYRQNASALARLHYPLVLKMWAWQTEPLPWKGGLVHMIPKKNVPTQASHYRGIALLKAVPKRIHAMLRTRVIRSIKDVRPEGQIGGFPAQQCPFGSQALRIFNQVAASRHVTSCVLFVDLKQAFHRLVRETVLGVADSRAFLFVQEELAKTGLEVSGLQSWDQTAGILTSLGASPLLVAILQDIHCETWTSPNGSDILHTNRGTRPGSPLADVIFHVVMIRIVAQIDIWLQEQPILQDALKTLGLNMQSVVWSDDLAIPLCTAQAQDLLPLLVSLLQYVYHVFEQFGFELNLDPGKTSAVVAFRGTGAPALRKAHLLTATPFIECEVAAGTSVKLHLLSSYKHFWAPFLPPTDSLTLKYANELGNLKRHFNSWPSLCYVTDACHCPFVCACLRPLCRARWTLVWDHGGRLRTDICSNSRGP